MENTIELRADQQRMFTVKNKKPIGWCPSVYRPMQTSDGLLVRLRPHLGRLTFVQLSSLCKMASRLGNGLLDITCRSNIQIRGFSTDTHHEFVAAIKALRLLDKDYETERRRNITVTPFWIAGDENVQLANALVERLHELPSLPDKFGFIIDGGKQPCLTDTSGDIRIERSKEGLIVRADKSIKGRSVTLETALDHLIEMAEWFVQHRMPTQTRMAEVVSDYDLPSDWTQSVPLSTQQKNKNGVNLYGDLIAVPAGRILASKLKEICARRSAKEIRLTPWYRVRVLGS